MRSSFRMLLTTLIVFGLALGTALAQDHNTPGRVHSAAESAPAPELTAADREQAVSSLADKWTATAEARGYRLEAWRSQLSSRLLRLDNDRLARALQARRYDELVEIVTGNNPARLLRAPEVLGDKSDDLSFTAITPCRLMDTRIGTGIYAGPLAAGSTTNISTSIISQIQAQGGRTGGCPELPGDAGALAYTLTVVDYAGNAFVLVYPFTAALPNASTINMGPGTSPTAMANSSVVLQCNLCGDELSIFVAGASTNVIIDAIGYYNPSPATTCTGNRTTTLTLDGTCQNYTSCTLTNPSTRSRTVVCQALVVPSVSHTVNVHDEFTINVATLATTCDLFPVSGGTGYFDINASIPTGCCHNQSVSAQNTFTLATNTTQTYYLNAQRDLGTGSLIAGQVRCTLMN